MSKKNKNYNIILDMMLDYNINVNKKTNFITFLSYSIIKYQQVPNFITFLSYSIIDYNIK